MEPKLGFGSRHEGGPQTAVKIHRDHHGGGSGSLSTLKLFPITATISSFSVSLGGSANGQLEATAGPGTVLFNRARGTLILNIGPIVTISRRPAPCPRVPASDITHAPISWRPLPPFAVGHSFRLVTVILMCGTTQTLSEAPIQSGQLYPESVSASTNYDHKY